MSEPSRNDNEEIARRAYALWEAEGRPHGRDREHWEAAAREIGSTTPMPPDYKDGAPAAEKKPATRRKKAAGPAEQGEKPAAPRRKRTMPTA